jgi:hypothetical protein
MPPRRLEPDQMSLFSLWIEIVHTEVRLAARPSTEDLAPPLTGILERMAAVEQAQRGVMLARMRADARVMVVDQDLDRWTRKLDKELDYILDDKTSHPRYRKYFKGTMKAVVHLGLRSQLAVVREWGAALVGEAEDALKALGAALGGLITAGDGAVAARQQAALGHSKQRIDEIIPLFEDVNAARMSIYAELLKRATDAGERREWAEAFFVHRSAGGGEDGDAADQEAAPA